MALYAFKTKVLPLLPRSLRPNWRWSLLFRSYRPGRVPHDYELIHDLLDAFRRGSQTFGRNLFIFRTHLAYQNHYATLHDNADISPFERSVLVKSDLNLLSDAPVVPRLGTVTCTSVESGESENAHSQKFAFRHGLFFRPERVLQSSSERPRLPPVRKLEIA